jgi:hypothetical protein
MEFRAIARRSRSMKGGCIGVVREKRRSTEALRLRRTRKENDSAVRPSYVRWTEVS